MQAKIIELVIVFATLSMLAVGGGNAVLPAMEQSVVLTEKWLTAEQFINVFSLGQIAPGPNMTMVALIGEKVAGPIGALAVLAAFFIPSSILVFFVGRIWKHFEGSPWRESAQDAFAPITIGLMLGGVWAIGKHAITEPFGAFLALSVAVILLRRKINPVYLIAIAALLTVAKSYI
jgi:chromate transporter